MKTKIFPFLLICIIGFAACDSKRVFDEYQAIDNETWNSYKAAKFNFTITDTISSHNIIINNRITSQYAYSNMYLFVHTYFPNGQSINDTLDCVLAAPSGRFLGKRKWLGNGFGNIWLNKIPYKMNVRFPTSGVYTIEIEQGMRDENLHHVLDIGVRIEKSN